MGRDKAPIWESGTLVQVREGLYREGDLGMVLEVVEFGCLRVLFSDRILNVHSSNLRRPVVMPHH